MSAAKKVQAAAKHVYRARPGFFISDAEAQVVGEFCETVQAKHGSVTPTLFLKEAKGDARVRRFIDWDDASAANKFRLEQAGRLIRSFTVTVSRNDRDVEVRGLQFVDKDRGYVPAGQVFADAEMSAAVLERAKKDAVGWYHRYQHLRTVAGLGPIFEAIEANLDVRRREAAA